MADHSSGVTVLGEVFQLNSVVYRDSSHPEVPQPLHSLVQVRQLLPFHRVAYESQAELGRVFPLLAVPTENGVDYALHVAQLNLVALEA